MPPSYDSTAPQLDKTHQAALLPPPSATPPRRCCSPSVIVFSTLFLLILLVAVDAFTTKYTESFINATLDWIEANPAWGVGVYAALYAVATVLFVPGSLLTLGAGFAFSAASGSAELGTVLGSASVLVGASLGAVTAFLLGRFVFRSVVEGWVKKGREEGGNMKFWAVLDSALSGDEGAKIMLLLRLSPLLPFNALNYLCGTTGISLKAYCVSLSGIVPGTILYVYLGAASADLTTAGQGGGAARTTMLVVGAVMGLVAVVWTSRVRRSERRKERSDEALRIPRRGAGRIERRNERNPTLLPFLTS